MRKSEKIRTYAGVLMILSISIFSIIGIINIVKGFSLKGIEQSLCTLKGVCIGGIGYVISMLQYHLSIGFSEIVDKICSEEK